jgi:hypothetical protein
MGGDVAGSDDQERAGMRQHALACLCTELVALETLLGGGKHEGCLLVRRRLQHREQDPDFNRFRGDAISAMPEVEREGCRKLWEDARGMRKRVASKKCGLHHRLAAGLDLDLDDKARGPVLSFQRLLQPLD